MNEDYFFSNLEAAREKFLATPAFNKLNAADPVEGAIADSEPPEKCPACGQTELGWYDNRTDEQPNWRCKNKKCGERVFIPLPGQEKLPGVSDG